MKTRIYLFVILLIGFLFANHLHSQESPYVFRYIGVTDGLPDNYVKSVFPLPDGRIGIRTTVLLSLYDGSNYSNFPFNFEGNIRFPTITLFPNNTLTLISVCG